MFWYLINFYAIFVKLYFFVAGSVCCFNDFDIMSGSALLNLDVKTAEYLSEGKFCIFFVQALQPKLIVSWYLLYYRFHTLIFIFF